MSEIFQPKARRIAKRTAYKNHLYEIEYAPGVFTNVYADSMPAAFSMVIRPKTLRETREENIKRQEAAA